ncbi:MAG: HNH endonuclease signature motif containing protein, partial [Nocardioides sp.]
LGGASQVLDLGRRRRFHTGSQRIALAIRDRGCTALGCDAPPGLCHAHHDHPWSTGGHTDTTTGRLLCPKHHALAHDQTYETNPTAHGKLRFIQRT